MRDSFDFRWRSANDFGKFTSSRMTSFIVMRAAWYLALMGYLSLHREV